MVRIWSNFVFVIFKVVLSWEILVFGNSCRGCFSIVFVLYNCDNIFSRLVEIVKEIFIG